MYYSRGGVQPFPGAVPVGRRDERGFFLFAPFVGGLLGGLIGGGLGAAAFAPRPYYGVPYFPPPYYPPAPIPPGYGAYGPYGGYGY